MKNYYSKKERERKGAERKLFIYVEANNSFIDFLNKHSRREREKWMFKEHQGWLIIINATHCIQQQQNYHVHF
jgi:hypothetical protein